MTTVVEFARPINIDLLDRLDGYMVEITLTGEASMAGELGHVRNGWVTVYQDCEPAQVELSKVKKVVIR